MKVADFVKEFKNAILINSDTKSVWVVKQGRLKVYSQKYYHDFVNAIDITKVPL